MDGTDIRDITRDSLRQAYTMVLQDTWLFGGIWEVLQRDFVNGGEYPYTISLCEDYSKFIGRLKNLKALDVLPYHTMGVSKYKELGIAYPLDGMAALPVGKAAEAKKYILQGIKNVVAH